MLLVVALLLIVVIVLARRVEDVEDVPCADVPVEGASVADVHGDVPVEGVFVAEDITVEDVKNINVIDVDIEEELKTLCQILSQRSSRKSSKIVEGPEVKRIRPRSQGKKTYWPSMVVIIEAETEEERVAREFDKKFFGRRASKRKSNFRDLKPAGRRPRDNKEKGDFRVDRRLKASRQKKVIESRA